MSDGSEIRSLREHDDVVYGDLVDLSGIVYSVAFSPDGAVLASGSRDKTINLWRLSDGQLLRTLRGHNDVVSSVAFSPDGAVLVSGGADKTIKLWRLSDGQLLRTLRGDKFWVYSVVFSSDGVVLASGGRDKTIKLWRVSDGQLLRTLRGHKHYVNSVAFNPGGVVLASGSGDGTIKLWRVSDGQLLRTLSGHNSWVNSVAFSPDGAVLASGSSDETIKLWRVPLNIQVQSLYAVWQHLSQNIDAEVDQRLKQSAAYQALQESQGRFESDAQYQSRLQGRERKEQELRIAFKKDVETTIAQKGLELQNRLKQDVVMTIAPGVYDANKEHYTVNVDGETIALKIPLNVAEAVVTALEKQNQLHVRYALGDHDKLIITHDKLMITEAWFDYQGTRYSTVSSSSY